MGSVERHSLGVKVPKAHALGCRLLSADFTSQKAPG